MELIELDATAQRALELLTNAGMSDGSIYDYTHTGFGSILRHFHTKGILYATAEMLDNFLLEQRVLLDQGDISQWKWGLVRRSCELLKQCATMNSIDLPDLQPWDPVWNRPKQIIQHDAPTAKQFAESENIYVLVWMVNKRMEQLGLSENTVRHYTEEGLAVILKKHYDSGTESYSDKLISQLIEERRLQYEQGEVGRTTYQNLRKAAAMLQEFRLTGKITLERIPNWGRREVIPQHKAILDKFSAHVTTQSNWAESSVSTVTSVARVFLLELEDHGIVSIETVAMMDIATCVTRMLGRYTGGMRSALFGIRTFLRFLYEAEITADNFCKTLPEFVCPRKNFREGFSDDELERLLSQPDITSAVGKRDYATVAAFFAKYGSMAKAVCQEVPEHIHPHMMRHTRAMHLYQSGMPMVLLSQYLGHSQVETTMIYAHADTEMKRAAIQKADAVRGTKPVPDEIWADNEEMILKLSGLL